MPAPWYSSADRRFRKREDVVLDSSACDYEDHLLTRRDESDIIAVELGALHHELVDPLRWCADFVAEKHWHWHFSYTSGTYDQLFLRGVAAMEELARQIWSYVLCLHGPRQRELIHVIALDPSELEMPWCRLFGGSSSKSGGKGQCSLGDSCAFKHEPDMKGRGRGRLRSPFSDRLTAPKFER